MKDFVSVRDYLNKLPVIGGRLKEEWVGEDENGNPVSMQEISCRSEARVKWRCSHCGREYSKPVYKKVMMGEMCSSCLKDHTPFPCLYLFCGLRQVWPNTIRDYHAYGDERNRRGMPFNLYVPEIGLLLDYFPGLSQSAADRLKLKEAAVREHGDTYLQIFNTGRLYPVYREGLIADHFFESDQRKRLAVCIKVLTYILESYGHHVDEVSQVSILRAVWEAQMDTGQERSLPVLFPELMKEWDAEKNQGLDPMKIRPSSSVKVWWKCIKCGYSWMASVSSRVNGRTRCKRCGWAWSEKKLLAPSGHLLVSGCNDLASAYPALAAEWDTEKNGVAPDQVKVSENVRRFWKCPVCGNEFQTRVYARIHYRTGCRKCRFNWSEDTPEEFKKQRQIEKHKKIIFDDVDLSLHFDAID